MNWLLLGFAEPAWVARNSKQPPVAESLNDPVCFDFGSVELLHLSVAEWVERASELELWDAADSEDFAQIAGQSTSKEIVQRSS